MLPPETWGHATLNLEPSIGWASEVNLDRVYDDGLARMHGDEWWRVGAEERQREQREREAARREAARRDERGEAGLVDDEDVDEDEDEDDEDDEEDVD